jgi:hypothetical protein
MKRIDINTVLEEENEEHRRFFYSLSYSERLRYCFMQMKRASAGKTFPKGRIFKIYRSHDEIDSSTG